MRKIKVSEIKQAYEFDIEMLRQDKKNSNRSKLIQRDKLMLQMLDTVPADLYISAEGTPTDSAKINAGSLAECLLKYHMSKEKASAVEKSGGAYDAKRGCVDVEIKLSINGSCYNTPVKDEMLVYLINRDGVFMIKKSEIASIINKKGILPHKEWDGAKHIKSLEKALGYNR